jgi:glucose/arabinose dehydrogenase
MKLITFTLLIFFNINFLFSQKFSRSELPAYLDTPWEIAYGSDGYLWVTESKGRVSRINPNNGSKNTVYTASDYFAGSSSERLQNCFRPNIGQGTLGLALHPDFPDSAYIYFVYSYNEGSNEDPKTNFKIVRLRWDTLTSKVVEATDIVMAMPSGYDHLGGRLIALKQNNLYYLYLSIGDNGISELNNPDCYLDQNTNPNTYTQDPDYKNGKIHRFYLDGSIPFDNPIPGNSFYTRGHRNPQGLAYNSKQNLIYEIEHGDRSDDEINILIKGMNYGWKNVRGYHSDHNIEGEEYFIDNYEPNPNIKNDSLVEAMYSWCASVPSNDPNNSNWCTVAPSDGIFYNSNAIPEWENSLLVVTLKNGSNTDQEVYKFKLTEDGKKLVPSTDSFPNPKKYFSQDQSKNGRLRDIAISPDGKKIYLINNGGANRDKITVYTYNEDSATIKKELKKQDLKVFPNPVKNILVIESKNFAEKEIINLYGKTILYIKRDESQINVSNLSPGLYILRENENSILFLKE